MLVEESGAFDLEQEDAYPNVTVGRTDVITYRVSLDDGIRQKTLWLSDVTAPASIRPLLAYLRKLAIEQRRAEGNQSNQRLIISSSRCLTAGHSVSRIL
jgi:hypothetical protein